MSRQNPHGFGAGDEIRTEDPSVRIHQGETVPNRRGKFPVGLIRGKAIALQEKNVRLRQQTSLVDDFLDTAIIVLYAAAQADVEHEQPLVAQFMEQFTQRDGQPHQSGVMVQQMMVERSEERRVGKECRL